MSDHAVPEIVRAAGERAVAGYEAFCAAPSLRRAHARSTPSAPRRFLRWAERRERKLDTITTADLETYATELAVEKSKHEALIYLSPVRGLFARFVVEGVLAIDPCSKGQPNGRGKITSIGDPEPSLPLSDLKRIVLDIGESDGWKEGDEDLQAGLIMIAAAVDQHYGAGGRQSIHGGAAVPGRRVCRSADRE